MSKLDFADNLAHSLEERKNLLKLLSMNHYDMEENSRMECLVEFKVVYGKALSEVRNCLEHFFPNMTMENKQDFIFSFFPFMFGIYPYTKVTKKKEAMMQAKVNYVYMTIYEITYAEVKRLLEYERRFIKMKKSLVIFISIFMILTLVACGKTSSNESSSNENSSKTTEESINETTNNNTETKNTNTAAAPTIAFSPIVTPGCILLCMALLY